MNISTLVQLHEVVSSEFRLNVITKTIQYTQEVSKHQEIKPYEIDCKIP